MNLISSVVIACYLSYDIVWSLCCLVAYKRLTDFNVLAWALQCQSKEGRSSENALLVLICKYVQDRILTIFADICVRAGFCIWSCLVLTCHFVQERYFEIALTFMCVQQLHVEIVSTFECVQNRSNDTAYATACVMKCRSCFEMWGRVGTNYRSCTDTWLRAGTIGKSSFMAWQENCVQCASSIHHDHHCANMSPEMLFPSATKIIKWYQKMLQVKPCMRRRCSRWNLACARLAKCARSFLLVSYECCATHTQSMRTSSVGFPRLILLCSSCADDDLCAVQKSVHV